MIKSKERTKVITFVLMLALVLCMATPVPAYALNDSSNKAVNLFGYSFDAANGALKIYFDKNTSANVTKTQFKIYDLDSSVWLDLSSFTFTTGSGCGWTNVAAPSGTTVTLTSPSGFGVDKRYEVTVNNTILANNDLTLGSYQNRVDYTFKFRTPKSDGTYTTPGTVTVRPANDTNYSSTTSAIRIPVEGNIEFVVNQPVTNTSAAISGMKLEKSTDNGITWSNVITDSTFDSTPVTDADCYSAQVNDAGTCFFYPLTAGGKTTTAYNLDTDTIYKLTIPTLSGITDSQTTSYFRTVQGDVPGKLTPAAVASSVTSTSAVLTWDTSVIAPYPSGYNVYWSDNQYWSFESHKVNSSPITTTSTSITGLTPSTTYYFRVVPLNSYGEGAGYSPCSLAVTTDAS